MAGISEERWFQRVWKTSVITEEMLLMSHTDLLEYCGQLYRRLDRIINVLERAKKEDIHTLDSIMYAVGRQASTAFDESNVGYERLDDHND